MKIDKGLAILLGQHTGFLDHLIPMAHILNIPLLLNDPHLFCAAQLYYPPHPLLYSEEPEKIFPKYDLFLYAEPAQLVYGGFRFGEHIYDKPTPSICMLHGNSDKGRNGFWAERFVSETALLLYGNHMRDFFCEKHVLQRIEKVVTIGNFRYLFYQKHRSFFDKKIAPFLFDNTERKTLLYAPTWVDEDRNNQDSSSFFDIYPYLFDAIPSAYQLLVKLHPYYYHLQGDKVAQIEASYYRHEQIRFICDMPLIYPLLHHIDGLLGDFSSIGYDFLVYNRPHFFLLPPPERVNHSYLFDVGYIIEPSDYKNIWKIIDDTMGKDKGGLKRERLYAYAFDTDISLADVRRRIEEL